MIPNAYVLRALSDGKFHSGEELGSLLGVSRAAVWKQLQQLEAYGIQIESARGLGYRIAGGIELLDRSLLSEQLALSSCVAIGLHVLDCVDSTNSYLMSLEKAGEFEVCVAEYQAGGRGRRGRSWVSPYAASLYVSVRHRFESGIAVLEGLSLAVGVELVKVLRNMSYDRVALKWPNDLLSDGKKLGGVLIEVNGDPSGAVDVVVGVGINVRIPALIGSGIDQPWTDLSLLDQSQTPSRNLLAIATVKAIVDLLSNYERKGFAFYQSQWNDMDACAGRLVELKLGDKVCRGVARGVDAQGAILLEQGDRLVPFSGGEISLRAKP